MPTSPRSRARGLQRLPSLNYYNVLRTMIGLLFGSPVVLPRYDTRPSLESAMAGPISFTDSPFLLFPFSYPIYYLGLNLPEDSCKKDSGLISLVPATPLTSLSIVSFY